MMHRHDGVRAIVGEENDFSGTRFSHGGDHGIGRVEHGKTSFGTDILNDDALNDRNVFDRIDV